MPAPLLSIIKIKLRKKLAWGEKKNHACQLTLTEAREGTRGIQGMPAALLDIFYYLNNISFNDFFIELNNTLIKSFSLQISHKNIFKSLNILF